MERIKTKPLLDLYERITLSAGLVLIPLGFILVAILPAVWIGLTLMGIGVVSLLSNLIRLIWTL